MDWGINVGENWGRTQYSRKQSLTIQQNKMASPFFHFKKGMGVTRIRLELAKSYI
jgi:hypothetical protein